MNYTLLLFTLLVASSCAFMAPTPSDPASKLAYGPSTLDSPLGSVEVTTPKKFNPTVKAPGRPAHVQEVTNLSDFKQVVSDEPDKLVVVRFYAPWCRACKQVTPMYYKLTRELGEDNVKFVDCPMTSVNTDLHKEMGIKAIPFAHIYHPQAGLVEERSVSRKSISNFEKVVKSYLGGICDVLDTDCWASDQKMTLRKGLATH